MMWAWQAAIFLIFLANRFLCQSSTSQAYCYITVSGGAEYCYYYSPGGYQCDVSIKQDPAHRNLSSCAAAGLCYILVSGGTEVCYYTSPFGYNCYFQVDPKVISNMTSCDRLQVNTPPNILFDSSIRVADENAEIYLGDVTITDTSIQSHEAEGRGFLMVTLQATNGFVYFNPLQASMKANDQIAAAAMLANGDKFNGGILFITGNGSKTTMMQFEARLIPLQAVLKSLAFVGSLYFNRFFGMATLTITANDEGGVMNAIQQVNATISFDLNPVNIPPFIFFPAQSPVNEDNTLNFKNFKINDVDVDETPPPNNILEVDLSVKKGVLAFPSSLTLPSGITFSADHRSLTITSNQSMVNSVLASLQYTPYAYSNDHTGAGVDNLTVTASDFGHTGKLLTGTTTVLVVPLHVNPVNNAPVILGPSFVNTDEGVSFQGFNLTVWDVDTFYGLTATMTVSSGVLSCSVASRPDLCAQAGLNTTTAPTSTLKFTSNLADMNDILAQIVYSPNLYFRGSDTLMVNVNDGQSYNSTAASKYISIYVDAVNYPPILTWTCPTYCVGGNYTPPATTPAVALGYSPVFSGTDTGPVMSVYDPDAGSLWLQLLVSASKGSLQLATTSGLAQITVPNNSSVNLSTCTASTCPSLILVMGSQSVLNQVLNGFVYYRTSAGTDNLIIAVNDLQHSGKGTAKSVLTSIRIY